MESVMIFAQCLNKIRRPSGLFLRAMIGKMAKTGNIALLLLVIVDMVPAVTQAQSWSGILDSTRAANWQRANVGVPGGIPANYTQCGSTVPSSTSITTVNALIAACGPNTYLFLGPGTFNFSAGVLIRGKSNFILRGSGPLQTTLSFTAGVRLPNQGGPMPPTGRRGTVKVRLRSQSPT